MSNEEKRILEMLQEMNQIADLANCVKKITEEIDKTVYVANVKTLEVVNLQSPSNLEISFSEALQFVLESSNKVNNQLNKLINELSGLSHTNPVKEV